MSDLKKILRRVFYGDPAWQYGRVEAVEKGYLMDVSHLAGGIEFFVDNDLPCTITAKLFDRLCDEAVGDVYLTNLLVRKSIEKAFSFLRMAQQLGHTQTTFYIPLPEDRRERGYAAILIEDDLCAYVVLGTEQDFRA